MHLFQQHAPTDPDAALARIPVLDLAPVRAGTAGALQTLGAQVAQACEQVGFFYVRGHGVATAVVEAAFAQSRRVHALAPQAKQALALDQNNIGYLAMNTSMQAHSTVHRATRPNENESFFVTHDRTAQHPDVVAGLALRGRNQWPPDLPGFREATMDYFHALHGLGQQLVQVFAVALGLPADGLDRLFSDDNHATLRLLHYPPTSGATDAFGTGPHTDNSFMTILARTEVPGLGVKLPSGEWICPPVLPDTFLVNIGNIARRLSNDRFLSTPHAVIVDGERDRYSIAYFHSPHPYRTLEVVPSCITAARPARYPPALYADLIHEFFAANYFHQRGHGRVAMQHRYD